MKRILSVLALIFGLLLFAAPVSHAAAVSSDQAITYIGPQHLLQADFVISQVSVIVPCVDNSLAPLALGVEKPGNNMCMQSEEAIMEVCQSMYSRDHSLSGIGSPMPTGNNCRKASPTCDSQGARIFRLDIGENYPISSRA